jgi:ubiquinone/menaquinone biosynthesis C-methylase UbiE
VSSDTAFDFDRMANSFDQVQPLFEAVTGRLIQHVPRLREGMSVLDIACGTGEPGLTLAASCPGVRLLGVDKSDKMIDIARAKADAKGLSDARFEVMSSEQLAVADGDVDVVVSRMGVLQFADPMIEAREVARVLRPGGTFSIATWDALSKNILTYVMSSSVREWLPPQIDAMLQRMEEFAMPGRRESWLTRAGLVDVNSELWSWPVEFPDESSAWELATGPVMFGAALQGLDDQLAKARTEFSRLLADYRRPDGSYLLPYACRLIWGSR